MVNCDLKEKACDRTPVYHVYNEQTGYSSGLTFQLGHHRTCTWKNGRYGVIAKQQQASLLRACHAQGYLIQYRYI